MTVLRFQYFCTGLVIETYFFTRIHQEKFFAPGFDGGIFHGNYKSSGGVDDTKLTFLTDNRQSVLKGLCVGVVLGNHYGALFVGIAFLSLFISYHTQILSEKTARKAARK